ncbi:MAG: MBL fold metallo-hydrolase [Holosporales bacterium]|nr:MBL fold metallo-hydrolase [Holosporales bacterium]
MRIKTFVKYFVIVPIVLALGFVLLIYSYTKLPMFGAIPNGSRQEKIQKLPYYADGKFHNIYQKHGVHMSLPGAVWKLLSTKTDGLFSFLHWLFSSTTPPHSQSSRDKSECNQAQKPTPAHPIPALNVDWNNLPRQQDIAIWLGHSSCFFQISGRRILVDPLFSKVSSPLLFFPKAFEGTDIFKPQDLPDIDILIITHDHWDHLDYKTVLQLRGKVKKVVCPIGVGAHFERWGYDPSQIVEMSWGEALDVGSWAVEPALSVGANCEAVKVTGAGFKIYCLPAHHSSGRHFTWNKSLWASFLIWQNSLKIYLSGDSGYSKHYADIGAAFAPIDFAFLNSGQYDARWPHNHLAPVQVVKAMRDLGAKKLLPIHICKLSIGANHAWAAPLRELKKASAALNQRPDLASLSQRPGLASLSQRPDFASLSQRPDLASLSQRPGLAFELLTPQIGEVVDLRNEHQTLRTWWECKP